jgi:phosphoserine phosphatase
MRQLIILWTVVLSSACAQLPPAAVAKASARQAQAVVFDIDGTLTPQVSSIFEARPDAAKAVKIFADKGYKIIYLSTRNSWFSALIPGWLKSNNFPDGEIHVAQTDEDRSHPDVYKTRMLKDFIAQGWQLSFAYGDSSTDFAAYAAADIPKEHVFALLRRYAADCQPGDWKDCLKGWTEHLGFLTASVPSALAN